MLFSISETAHVTDCGGRSRAYRKFKDDLIIFAFPVTQVALTYTISIYHGCGRH